MIDPVWIAWVVGIANGALVMLVLVRLGWVR